LSVVFYLILISLSLSQHKEENRAVFCLYIDTFARAQKCLHNSGIFILDLEAQQRINPLGVYTQPKKCKNCAQDFLARR
jgi:hypothetical protein